MESDKRRKYIQMLNSIGIDAQNDSEPNLATIMGVLSEAMRLGLDNILAEICLDFYRTMESVISELKSQTDKNEVTSGEIQEKFRELQKTNLSYIKLWDIVADYGKVLEDSPSKGVLPTSALPESILPLHIIEMRRVIALLYIMEKNNDRRAWLEGAYLLLANFISDKEYELLHSLTQNIHEAVFLNKEDKINEVISQLANSEKWDECIKCCDSKTEELNGDLRILRRILGLSEETIHDEVIGEDLKAFTRKLNLTADKLVKDNK
ncbi:MAG: hypothetical protein HW396_123 [Candidatus Dadabacteria bacterium]|nr:hypothetical protein [Candidatus Dadabacteria bacterium]